MASFHDAVGSHKLDRLLVSRGVRAQQRMVLVEIHKFVERVTKEDRRRERRRWIMLWAGIVLWTVAVYMLGHLV